MNYSWHPAHRASISSNGGEAHRRTYAGYTHRAQPKGEFQLLFNQISNYFAVFDGIGVDWIQFEWMNEYSYFFFHAVRRNMWGLRNWEWNKELHACELLSRFLHMVYSDEICRPKKPCPDDSCQYAPQFEYIEKLINQSKNESAQVALT